MRTKKNGWIVVILFILFISFPGKTQVLKIENGIAFSHLHLPNAVTELYDLGVYPYQMSVGLDYMDRGWFALSSNVGYLRKGGGMSDMISQVGEYVLHSDLFCKADYLTVNTTFRIKGRLVAADRFTLYAGAGPRVDFLLKEGVDYHPDFNNELEELFHGNDVIVGFKCEAGFDYAFGRYQIGLNAAWLPSFTKIVGEFRDRTFTLGFVLGYRLGKE